MTSDIFKQNFELKKENARLRQENNELKKENNKLKRKLKEEVGINVIDYNLFDADSVAFEWQFKEDVLVKVHHTGIFFKVEKYENEIKNIVEIDDVNNDSLGAEFYEIAKLNKNSLSAIALLELEKMGYDIKD